MKYFISAILVFILNSTAHAATTEEIVAHQDELNRAEELYEKHYSLFSHEMEPEILNQILPEAAALKDFIAQEKEWLWLHDPKNTHHQKYLEDEVKNINQQELTNKMPNSITEEIAMHQQDLKHAEKIYNKNYGLFSYKVAPYLLEQKISEAAALRKYIEQEKAWLWLHDLDNPKNPESPKHQKYLEDKAADAARAAMLDKMFKGGLAAGLMGAF